MNQNSEFLENDFKRAQKRVWDLKTCSNDNKLKIYGLYKQATEGDTNTKQPGMFSGLKARMKWDSWKGYEGMLSMVAKREYIKLVTELFEKQ
jgi:diazepam-binding inhibitor (GABA receptor modulating acyl-CoA-binding protein)